MLCLNYKDSFYSETLVCVRKSIRKLCFVRKTRVVYEKVVRCTKKLDERKGGRCLRCCDGLHGPISLGEPLNTAYCRSINIDRKGGNLTCTTSFAHIAKKPSKSTRLVTRISSSRFVTASSTSNYTSALSLPSKANKMLLSWPNRKRRVSCIVPRPLKMQ